MPIKLPPQYEMVGAKKSPKIKNIVFGKAEEVAAKIPSASAMRGSAVDLVKRTASTTKERMKARAVTASEVAVGGVVIKATTVALSGITATGATAAVVSAAPVVAGLAAGCVVSAVIKNVIDGTPNDNDNDND